MPTAIPHGIAPSILAADAARLGEQVDEVLAAGARAIHVDIMDGHFVETLSYGPTVVSALADRIHAAGGYIDVHLMVQRPERRVEEFARAGADCITVHIEATPHIGYALAKVRESGCHAGLSLCPGTPARAAEALLGEFDLLLCMSVNPGWGGQTFLPKTPAKIEQLRDLLGHKPVIEVDGGIDASTVGSCIGANLFVAGSAIFGAPDPAAALATIATARPPDG